jgi:hypothetical protein
MANTQFSPSKVTLVRANAQAKIDSMKEKSAAIRSEMGLEGKQLVKVKPMSAETQAKVEARHGKK